eukprot:TRINITY_DN91228_c0_g1_i1.p1 TRINITY_DN91228_c0_g1~~TRINITY_DN91228_c0_g1_i1.p1  ORF type:complete len:864 (+),score=120.20 TRINITY_DN91228_c0_g1_i1:35-2626(+)
MTFWRPAACLGSTLLLGELTPSFARSSCESSDPLDWPALKRVVPGSVAWLWNLLDDSRDDLDMSVHRQLIMSMNSLQTYMLPYFEKAIDPADPMAGTSEPCVAIVWLFSVIIGWLQIDVVEGFVGSNGILNRMNWAYVLKSGWPVYRWMMESIVHLILIDSSGLAAEAAELVEEVHKAPLLPDVSGRQMSVVKHALSALNNATGACIRQGDGMPVCTLTADIIETEFAEQACAAILALGITTHLETRDEKALTNYVSTAFLTFRKAFITPELVANTLLLLSALQKLWRPEELVDCWRQAYAGTRLYCCGVVLDHCCSSTAHHWVRLPSVCWSESIAPGLTHERCCNEFQSDVCVHDFKEKSVSEQQCHHYVEDGYALMYSPCVAWTMPDAQFAKKFAAPLLAAGLTRCFEVELSFDASVAVKMPFGGVKRLSEYGCNSGGCPWALFGVCAPLVCDELSVLRWWRLFLGLDLTQCEWETARVREYRSAEELLETWTKPIKVMHYAKTAGHAWKRRLVNWRDKDPPIGWGDQTRPRIPPLLLCQTVRHIPTCDADYEGSYAIFVREPTEKLVSHFTAEMTWTLDVSMPDVLETFPTPQALGEALRDPAAAGNRMQAAWEAFEIFLRDTFTSHFGGALHALKCLQLKKLVFAGRREHVEQDVAAFQKSLSGGEESPAVSLDHNPTFDFVNTGRHHLQNISEPAREAFRAHLAEDYFILALFVWHGLLPTSYLSRMRMRQPPPPALHALGQLSTSCSSACTFAASNAARWLGDLLSLPEASPWWLMRYRNDRVHTLAVVSEAVGRALLQVIADQYTSQPTVLAVAVGLLSPDGTIVATAGDAGLIELCKDHLAQLAALLCEAELAAR